MPAVVAACGLGWVVLCAEGAEVVPPNPPRTQQQILQERLAACRDLTGPALRDCMANYVGTPDKSQSFQEDDRPRENGSHKLPPGAEQRPDGTQPEVGSPPRKAPAK